MLTDKVGVTIKYDVEYEVSSLSVKQREGRHHLVLCPHLVVTMKISKC